MNAITVPFDFNAASTVTYTENTWGTLGGVRRVEVSGFNVSSGAAAGSVVWIRFKDFGTGVNTHQVKLADGRPSILQICYPVPVSFGNDCAGPLTVATFKGSESKLPNQVSLSFYDNAGDPVSLTGILWVTFWTDNVVEQ